MVRDSHEFLAQLMSRKATALTDPRILALPVKAKRYSVHDALCPGLIVRIYPKTGKKTFMLAARYPGSSNIVRRQLGIVGQLLVADARVKARRWLAWIAEGKDPAIEEEHLRRANQESALCTFGVVAEDYLKRHVRGQRKARRVEQEIRSELIPHWKDRPISSITKVDLVRLIERLLDRPGPQRKGPARAYAHSVFGHVRGLWNWAINRGIYSLESSPCDRMKPSVLIGKKRQRHRTLSDRELAAFWNATGVMGYPNGSLFRMLLLTGCRLRECSMARWREIDIPNALLTVPRERFKSDSVHQVPLTPPALELLEGLPRFKSGDLLFSPSWGKLPVQNFDRALKRLRKLMLDKLREDDPEFELEHFIAHDLRRCVRTHMSAMRVPEHVAEAVIGHGRKGLARVYDQHSMLPEIREALDAWALRLRGIVEPPSSNVVKIRAAE